MTGLIEKLGISESPLVNAALAIAAFYLVAKVVEIVFDKVARRFAKFTESDVDDKVIEVIHRPVYRSILFLGIVHAIEYLQPSERALRLSSNFFHSLIAVIWAITLLKVARILLEAYIKSSEGDDTGLGKDVLPLAENVSKIVVVGTAVVVIFTIWEINVTPLLASAGIMGAGLAIAAKDAVANLLGGISVFLDKPFKPGDSILLEAGLRGEVVTIGLRSTRLRTVDGILITIPNSVIANSRVANESAPLPTMRIRIPVSVAYGTDLEAVGRTLLTLAHATQKVLPEPAAQWRFIEFGDSGLKLELQCWIADPAHRVEVTHRLNLSIYNRFNELGIVIPCPQMDVRVRNAGTG